MKYLLTGGSGVLGTELRKYLGCEAPSSKDLDITKQGFRLDGIDVVVHCAAYTNVPGAEVERAKAFEVNESGTKYLRDAFDGKLVYISTDYVYPGLVGNYRETDPTSPFNAYGESKLAGERTVCETDLVIRTSFKPNKPWAFPSAFTDLYTSADYVDVVAELVYRVIISGAEGVINVGTERKSVYDLASRRNTVGKKSVQEITNVKLPRDISMNLDRLRGLV